MCATIQENESLPRLAGIHHFNYITFRILVVNWKPKQSRLPLLFHNMNICCFGHTDSFNSRTCDFPVANFTILYRCYTPSPTLQISARDFPTFGQGQHHRWSILAYEHQVRAFQVTLRLHLHKCLSINFRPPNQIGIRTTARQPSIPVTVIFMFHYPSQ